MHATKQPTTESRITAVCTITDSAEQQRRLARVYDLIMALGRQKRVVAETESAALAQPTG
jgi:hypothetical protein